MVLQKSIRQQRSSSDVSAATEAAQCVGSSDRDRGCDNCNNEKRKNNNIKSNLEAKALHRESGRRSLKSAAKANNARKVCNAATNKNSAETQNKAKETKQQNNKTSETETKTKVKRKFT